MSDRSTEAGETTRHMKAAVERADLDAFMATLSPEVVLRSPISSKAELHGTAEMRETGRERKSRP